MTIQSDRGAGPGVGRAAMGAGRVRRPRRGLSAAVEGLEGRQLLAGDPPVALADVYATPTGTPLNVAAPGVLGNDTDAESDALTAAVVTNPANGQLTLNADGSFVYTPNANFRGVDSFTYKANDGTSDSADVTVTLNVNAVPVATNDAYSTPPGSTLSVNPTGVLANDTDADSDPLTASVVTNPASGTLTLNADGSFSYTPNVGFKGTDSFTYKVNDGLVDSAAAIVTLTVNNAPVATSDSYSVVRDGTLTVAAPGVLANDTDADGDSLTAAIVASPTAGNVTLNADGSFTYTPSSGFTGSDSFTYKVSDGAAESGVATVTIAVNAPSTNRAPVSAADTYRTNVATPLVVTAANGVLANDTDADNDTLTALLVTGPASGTLSLNANGSFTYTPNVGFRGTDSFTYKANDGTTDGPTTTVSLQVNNVPNAANDAYNTTNALVLNISVPGVLSNDTDPNGDALTALLISPPANGTLNLNANGSFTYTANSSFVGTDTFTYRVSDGLSQSEAATVSITVTAPSTNQAPVANNNSYTTTKGSPIQVNAANGVLANDTDANNNPLTASLVTPPTFGTLTLNPDGSFTYTPRADFSGTDAFTYRANDGTTTSSVATALLFVNAPGTGGNSTLTGRGVSGNDDGVLGDGITTNTRPIFTGIAPAGFVVRLFARKSGAASATQVGQVTAGSDGAYTVGASALGDGTFAFSATATDPSSASGDPAATVALGSLTINTAAPRVTAVRIEPTTGRVVLTFSAAINGANASAALAASSFRVTRGGRRVAITGVSLSAANEITLTLRSGARIRPGTLRLLATSANIQGTNARALDGEFTSSLPSGDGTPGGDFQARLTLTRRGQTIRPIPVRRGR